MVSRISPILVEVSPRDLTASVVSPIWVSILAMVLAMVAITCSPLLETCSASVAMLDISEQLREMSALAVAICSTESLAERDWLAARSVPWAMVPAVDSRCPEALVTWLEVVWMPEIMPRMAVCRASMVRMMVLISLLRLAEIVWRRLPCVMLVR